MNMMSIDCTLSRRLENIKLRWQSAAFYVAYFLYFLKMHVFCEKNFSRTKSGKADYMAGLLGAKSGRAAARPAQ